MTLPVIAGTAAILGHTPSLVRHGSKPARELMADRGLLPHLLGNLRSFAAAVGYGPNQAFIGALHPRQLGERPWLDRPLAAANRCAPFGEIMPEQEFLGLLALSDEFGLLRLNPTAAETAATALAAHPLAQYFPLARLQKCVGNPEAEVAAGALPLHTDGDALAAALRSGQVDDESLAAPILLENLACKASGALALAHLLQRCDLDPASIDYVIGCAEEAVGDRYQRGGGNMGKAIATLLNCTEASGADVKNFCAAPIPALVIAASLVSAGVCKRIAVVGGGSLPKLGMKFQGSHQAWLTDSGRYAGRDCRADHCR